MLTVVRLDISVSEEVGLEVAALVEGTTAGGTFVRGLLEVKGLMHSQRPCLAESFTTVRALEWFLFGMDVPGENRRKKNEKVSQA